MAVRFTFRQLEYLVAVGDAGTIAQASLQLNVSSPSISTAINQLARIIHQPNPISSGREGLAVLTGMT